MFSILDFGWGFAGGLIVDLERPVLAERVARPEVVLDDLVCETSAYWNIFTGVSSWPHSS
ncbi:hypothetical protein [Frankia sp. Cr2]|uniref:hypothetical protein n=1 Tax=Frankia sp. Cr2 TaxID=3073932 RepID=UPI002AD236C0|nr:hypothetical protein [Frankia sp. Cr2]